MSLLIQNIGVLATPYGNSPRSGTDQGSIREIKNAAFLLEDGAVRYAGPEDGFTPPKDVETIDAAGRLVTPGLVDAHTHLVFGGWRQHETGLKLAGMGYLDILKRGGGILDTVRHTREATEDELYEKAALCLKDMLCQGVTTCEAKSGYGLDLETERKQLRVIGRLGEGQPVSMVPTFLGAHAFPPEYADDHDGFVDYLCDTVIPRVAEEGLAEYCDVFCDDGVFDVPQSERILRCGLEHGLKPKIHADEIKALGGSQLAGRLHAVSAEHLIESGTEEIEALSRGGVIAALLPATSFYLGKTFARAREMVESGVPVAVASDFNPGSCPSYSLQFAMNLAFLRYRLTPAEILTAVTLNAACAVGRGGLIGSLEPGKRADALIWDAPDLDMICYRFGRNQVKTVIKDGVVVAEN